MLNCTDIASSPKVLHKMIFLSNYIILIPSTIPGKIDQVNQLLELDKTSQETARLD